MKPILYLHCGMWKTGSTAIQYFLNLNQPQLNKLGYTYPFLKKGHNAQQTLSDVFVNGVLDTTNAIAMASWAEIRDYRPPEGEKVIISNEVLQAPMLNPENAAFVQEQLKHFDLKIIVYLRRQDLHLESSYRHQIKNGQNLPPFETYVASRDRYYDIELAKMIALFGGENIVVRAHDKERFADGSIYRDFIKALGIPWSDAFKEPRQAINPGLHSDFIRFMAESNRAAIEHPQRQSMNLFLDWVVRRGQFVIPRPDYHLLTTDLRARIEKKYIESNISLEHILQENKARRTFGSKIEPAEQSFFSPYTYDIGLNDHEGESLQTIGREIITYFLTALRDKPSLSAQKMQELSAQANSLKPQTALEAYIALCFDMFAEIDVSRF